MLWFLFYTLILLVKLGICGDDPPPDGFHHIDRHAVPSLFVDLIVTLNGQHLVDAVICPALQTKTLPWGQATDIRIIANGMTVYRC